MTINTNPLTTDLDHILDHTHDLWDELRGERIFITGGTGFFGCWLLESFLWANDRLNLNASALILTRNPASFQKKMPHLAENPALRFLAGNMGSFSFPNGVFSHIIHAATEPLSSQDIHGYLNLFDANLQGTRKVLEFAHHCGAKRFLFTSSGAVYGKQPSEMTHIPEEYAGAPETVRPDTAYGQSKRISEFLCAAHAQERELGLEVKIARCFAFVGPYLPLDANYAIGNFIRDALNEESIKIGGDGTPYRSYLYAADLAIWLWKILLAGKSCQVYNVGSGVSITIAMLAEMVKKVISPGVKVIIHKTPMPNQQSERYVPSVTRARMELGLDNWISLEESIRRTADYYKR